MDTPKRKKTKLTLREERNLLRTLIDSLPDLIYVKDAESRFMINNTAHLHALGATSQDDVLEKTDLDLFPKELAEEYYTDEQEMIRSGQSIINKEEIVVNQTTNETRWMSVTKVPVQDDQGNTVALVGMNRDITERKQLQQQVQESLQRRERQVQVSLDLTQEIATEPSLPDLFQYVVDLLQEQIGYAHVSLYTLNEDNLVFRAGSGEVGRKMLEAGEKVALADDKNFGARVARSGEAMLVPDVSQESDWVVHPLLSQTNAVIIEPIKLGDKIYGLLDVRNETAASLDEEDRLMLMGICGQLALAIKNAQTTETLIFERDLFQALMDHSPDYIFFRDRRSRFIRTNQAHARLLLGLDDPDEAVGLTDFDLYPQEDARRFFDEEQRIMDTQTPVVGREWSLPSPSLEGEMIWISEHKIPITDKQGDVIGLVGIGSDITKRKQIEFELARERDLLQSLMDNSPDYLFFRDRESRFIRTNQAHAQQLLSLKDADEAVGLTDFDLFPKEDAQRFFDEEQRIMDTSTPVIGREWSIPSPSQEGKMVWLSENKLPMLDENGDVIGLIGMSRDVTERREMEALLAKRAGELETVAEVSTATSTILDTAVLLQKVVDLTRERFGLYHAHIYLLNDAGDTLDLVAGAGEKGRKMVAKGWQIPFDREQSLVARVARNRQGEVSNDVTADANWFANPFLPDTKSEMAVPLLVGERVLGVLDVQSSETDHFSEEDVRIQTTLAAQVAGAIEKARLFGQAQTALEETAQSKEAAEIAKVKAEQARREAETEKASAEAAREEAERAKKDIEVANKALEVQIWQTKGQAQLNDRMRGEQAIETLANNVISRLCKYLPAETGALYIMEEESLNRVGHYAYNADGATRFKLREGIVGQAAAEREPIFLTNIPSDQLTIRSGLGEAALRHMMVFPFMYEGQVGGVIELGTLAEFSQGQIDFMETAITNIGIAFNTAQTRSRINELLAETQQQAEELQAQSEELRVANEELETQTKSLQTSEAVLKDKQAILDQQNRELMVAQEELERKAKELALASKYKSEFLANMSHELRTPLNSLLILARMLADNKENNLTEEQVESAQVIHSGGTDLLNLINDILDLSKVEAGQMIFNYEAMPLTDLVASTHMQFDPVAEEKGVELRLNLSDDLPDRINTDPQRLKQIVKNLLSNAFKFTKEGSVSLDLYRPDRKVDLSQSGLDPAETIAIRVADTGIGMTAEQLQVIFEAFQQADGSTSRQYGGTGLGLSISRELAANLGGQIEVTSEPGQGSTFTLYLPIAKEGIVAESTEPSEQVQPTKPAKPKSAQPDKPAEPKLPPPKDDREELVAPGERDETVKIVAIIEDDPKFAKVVYNYAHKKGFKCLIAGEGETGLELVRNYQPDAVILDLNLPDMSGWEVLTTLKNDPAMRHIPVHIMSVDDEDLNAFKKGAMGYLTKPVSQEYLDEAFHEIEHFISQDIKSLLLVEDDANSRLSIKKLLDGNDVQISEADNGRQALDLLKEQPFDCMILDLSLPDMSGFEVLTKINYDDTIAKCPVIIYTGRDLTPEENMELMQYADRVIVKGVKSPERLLDETALFLHRVVADMPQEKQQTIKQLYNEDELLKDKKVLVVDDDMRNSFALSKLLSDKGIIVQIAKDGQKALDLLDEGLDVDLILMDIMMPVLDGYETIKRIRAQRKFNGLPILALTAKAMKGDREKCLEVGASDYLPKPVDVDRLFSMLRVWLYQ
jgi:tubulin-specific chaperone A